MQPRDQASMPIGPAQGARLAAQGAQLAKRTKKLERLAAASQPGKELPGGYVSLATQGGTYGPVPVASGTRTNAIMAIIVTGDGSTPILVEAYIPWLTVSGAAIVEAEIWDGAPGSGTRVGSSIVNMSQYGQMIVQAHIRPSAATSKTYQFSIVNDSAGSITFTVNQSAIYNNTMRATWAG